MSLARVGSLVGLLVASGCVDGVRRCKVDGDCAGYAYCADTYCTRIDAGVAIDAGGTDAGAPDGGDVDSGTVDAGPPRFLSVEVSLLGQVDGTCGLRAGVRYQLDSGVPFQTCNDEFVGPCRVRRCLRNTNGIPALNEFIPSEVRVVGTPFDAGVLQTDDAGDLTQFFPGACSSPGVGVVASVRNGELGSQTGLVVQAPPSVAWLSPECDGGECGEFSLDASVQLRWVPSDGGSVQAQVYASPADDPFVTVFVLCTYDASPGSAEIPAAVMAQLFPVDTSGGNASFIAFANQTATLDGGHFSFWTSVGATFVAGRATLAP